MEEGVRPGLLARLASVQNGCGTKTNQGGVGNSEELRFQEEHKVSREVLAGLSHRAPVGSYKLQDESGTPPHEALPSSAMGHPLK